MKKALLYFLPLIFVACSSNEDKPKENTTEAVVATIDTTNKLVAQVCLNGKFGYLGTDFKFVIEPQFDNALPFNEGLACVEQGKKWGFINIKGEFVIPPKYDYPGTFFEGLARVANNKSSAIEVPRYFFIDKTGNDVFGELYSKAEDFNNTLAYVEPVDGKGKYIDVNGKELDSVAVNAHPILYNHFKHAIQPFGGEVTSSIVLNKKTGKPEDIKYNKKDCGYLDELGHPATEAIYCAAGQFHYSFQTPKIYFSTNKNEIINSASSYIEVNGTYVRTESIEEGDNVGIVITFKTDKGEEITFDGYNAKSKLIPLYFVCDKCESPNLTVKSKVGSKYLLKYSNQKEESGDGGVREFKILEAVDIAK